MNLTLTRNQQRSDGIFGNLIDENNNEIAVTLEHAYVNPDGSFDPKLPVGIFTCQRSQHQLEGMASPFITFEIMAVPGHSNILFHWGNYNQDSSGCVLVGRRVLPNPDDSSSLMITSSKNTWLKLMDIQNGIDSFQLTVRNSK